MRNSFIFIGQIAITNKSHFNIWPPRILPKHIKTAQYRFNIFIARQSRHTDEIVTTNKLALCRQIARTRNINRVINLNNLASVLRIPFA